MQYRFLDQTKEDGLGKLYDGVRRQNTGQELDRERCLPFSAAVVAPTMASANEACAHTPSGREEILANHCCR